MTQNHPHDGNEPHEHDGAVGDQMQTTNSTDTAHKKITFIDPDERTPTSRSGVGQSAEEIMQANNFLGDL